MTKEEAKHLSEVLKASVDGKLIQYKANNEESWKDLPLDSWKQIIIDHYEFRIKPEPKYRPYKNAEEFLNAQKEHGMYLITKNNGDIARLPIIVESEKIFVQWKSEDLYRTVCTYSNLLKDWLHQDGTPCGIMEE